MIDKKLYKPATIVKWVVVIYEEPRRFSDRNCDEMIRGLMTACDSLGKCRRSFRNAQQFSLFY